MGGIAGLSPATIGDSVGCEYSSTDPSATLLTASQHSHAAARSPSAAFYSLSCSITARAAGQSTIFAPDTAIVA
jgi:hypothetical protein